MRILYIGLSLMAVACNPADCFKGAGSTITEKRDLGAFRTVIIKDNLQIELTNENTTTIEVIGGDKLLKKIKTELSGDILTLSNDNSCDWARSYGATITVRLSAKQIERIEYMGYGDISTREQVQMTAPTFTFACEGTGIVNLDLQANILQLNTKSAAPIYLKGTAQNLNIKVNFALGEIFAQGMRAQECTINHDYINDIHVFPIQKLTVTMNNKGNVRYYNNPLQIISSITGSGKLILSP